MPNSVELLGVYGGDETIALSAWTSSSRELTPEKRERIGALLKNTLIGLEDPDHGPPHTSPFEKGIVHFLVTTDIATHIHLLKHRVGVSINAESARYKELREDRAYIPDDWPLECQDLLLAHTRYSQALYHRLLRELVSRGMSRKRAKESARFVLTYNTQITADIMFHFNTFIHFLDLRNEAHAQLEIQKLAQQMLEAVRETHVFDRALDAYGWLNDERPQTAGKRISELERRLAAAESIIVAAANANFGECVTLPNGDCIGHGCMHDARWKPASSSS